MERFKATGVPHVIGNTTELEGRRKSGEVFPIEVSLTSWQTAQGVNFGAIIRDNGGVKEYGVLLTFTLKALPKFSFDLNFDPAGSEQTQ